MISLDNIIVGNPLVPVESLGVLKTDNTISFSFDELCNDDGNVFLPSVLVRSGMFKTTSEIRRINEQRMKSPKFNKNPDMNLWRSLDRPEMTLFKIGKNVFWLIVGD